MSCYYLKDLRDRFMISSAMQNLLKKLLQGKLWQEISEGKGLKIDVIKVKL